jgi:hypothetical protein
MTVSPIVKTELGNLSEEEIVACKELVTTMREERRKAEAIKKNAEWLWDTVTSTIDAIGLEETKRIIRNINRDLRSIEE